MILRLPYNTADGATLLEINDQSHQLIVVNDTNVA